MPSLTPTVALRSHLDSQLGILAELSRKQFDSAQRFSELNINLSRDLVDDWYRAARQALASGDPLQLASLLTRQAQPSGERLRNYAQQVGELLGGMQVDLSRAAEHVMPELSRAAQAFGAFSGNTALRAGPAGMFAGFSFPPRQGGDASA